MTVFLLALTSPQFASAGNNDAGLPGEFLNFGVGARPMGMGRAFTAVADDIDSLYWNPAGLSTYRSSQVIFQYSPLVVDGSYQYIGYSQPLYAYGNFGVGVVNLDSDDVPRVDANNTEVGSFKHRETGYLASYAYRFGEKFGTGATLKMAEKSIDGSSERGFGADLGGLYLLNERVRFGLVARNLIQPTYKYPSEKEEFPRIMRGGAAVSLFNEHVLTAVDLEKTMGTSQDLRWHFGVEGFVIKNIVLRAGLDHSEVTTGLGVRWKNLQFDYGLGFQALGFSNRLSMKVFFGGYEVDVKASPSVFSPVGLKNKVTFEINSSHRDRIINWILSIRNGKGKVVRSFQGYNEPPRVLEWDGKDAQDKIVEAGTYTYRMSFTTTKSRTEVTPTRSMRIVAPTPIEIESK